MNLEESGDFDAVDSDDVGAAALGFEAEPAVPRAGVEETLAGEVGGDGELAPTPLEGVEGNDAFEVGAVRQVEAVIPALGV